MAMQSLNLQSASETRARFEWSRNKRVEQLDFITAISQDVRYGSGCLVGIQTRKALQLSGVTLHWWRPKYICLCSALSVHSSMKDFGFTVFERMR